MSKNKTEMAVCACGAKGTKKFGSEWQCDTCAKIGHKTTNQRKKRLWESRSKGKEDLTPDKKSGAECLVEYMAPTIGIGDSLKFLDKLFKQHNITNTTQ